MKNFSLPLALLAIAALTAMLLGQTSGPAAPAAIPSRLAVVNLGYIFDHLDEKLAAQAAFEAMSKTYNEEKAKKDAELEKLGKDLANQNLFKPGAPEYLRMQDEALRKATEVQSFIEYVKAKLAIEQKTKTAELYKHINEAIEAYSKANDIALVFVTDDPNFENVASVQEIQFRANSRKVVYADFHYDITKKVLEKMNTDFMLGAGAPAGRATTRPGK